MAITRYEEGYPSDPFGGAGEWVDRPQGGREFVRPPISAPRVVGASLSATTPGGYAGYPQYGGAGAGAEPTRRMAQPFPFSGTPRMTGRGAPGAARQPIGQVTTRRTTFEGQMPTLQLRRVDESRIRALTQKMLAPNIRLLRTALNRALTRAHENPEMRRRFVRSALQEYGAGLAGGYREAFGAGLQMEAAEREVENRERMAQYQAALERFRTSGREISTVTPIFTEEQARRARAGEDIEFGGGGAGIQMRRGPQLSTIRPRVV